MSFGGVTNDEVKVRNADGTTGILPEAQSLSVALATEHKAILQEIASNTVPSVESSIDMVKVGGSPLTLGQKVMAGSVPVVIASDQDPISVDIGFGQVSVLNSTITALPGAGAFIGGWEDVSDFATISFSLFSDQPSATGGLSTQWSSDGANPDVVDNTDVFAAQGRAFSLSVRARYFRIVYTNGPTPQLVFRLSTVFHKTGTGLISRPLTQNLTDNNYAQTVRAVINAKLPSGSYKAASVGQVAMVDSVGVVIASDQTPIPISAASLPLPSGASTSSNQATGNASLASIDSKLSTLGQKAMSASIPVAVASDQSPIQTIGSVANGAAGNPSPVVVGGYDGTNAQSLRTVSAMSLQSALVLSTGRIVARSEQGFAFQSTAEINIASSGIETPIFLLRNPAGSGRRLYLDKLRALFLTTTSAGDIMTRVYVNPTVTIPGTIETIVSRYLRTSPTAPVATAFSSPTIGLNGTRFDILRVGGTNIPLDDFREYDLSVILDPGRDILITGNASANNRILGIVIDWVEAA